jgi:hypothetical protein
MDSKCISNKKVWITLINNLTKRWFHCLKVLSLEGIYKLLRNQELKGLNLQVIKALMPLKDLNILIYQ